MIKAKALEENKLNNTYSDIKTTYEEVEFTRLADAANACEEEVFYYTYDGEVYTEVKDDTTLAEYYFKTGILKLYSKKEVTPMEAAKRVCEDSVEINEQIDFCSSFGDFLEDNTKWEGYDLAFIDICRTIVEAYDGKGK